MKGWIFALLLLPMVVTAQKAAEQTVKSEIKKVKLFLTSGEMTHETELKLAKGRNKIVFSGISAYADPRSIQFSSPTNYRLVSVSTEIDFLAAEEFNPRIKVLKDSLEQLKDRYQSNLDMLGAYQAELSVLNSNKDLGDKQNISIALLKEAADFYRTRTLEINRATSKINKEQREIDDMIGSTRYQLTELNYNENQRSNQVVVLIDCDQATSADVVLKYQVSDCGWTATYDLSAMDVNQTVNLKYKAQVHNNTGNEWKNVQLTLSTADPRLSASSPVMTPWYLDYNNDMQYGGKKNYEPMPQQEQAEQSYRQQAENEINMANRRSYDNYMLDKRGDQQFARNEEEWSAFNSGGKAKPTNVVIEQIEISELTAEFAIPAEFSCPSDAKPYIVDIKELNIPATFTHVSIPKLDQGAFLLANIVGWQDLDLMPGPTNVYFAGNYVGRSHIDTRNVSDTLALSFGRDPKIQVMRKLKSEMSTRKVSGSTRKDTYMYDVMLRNNRTTSVKINVFDQIPVSRNSEIVVSTETTSDGKKDDVTGEVSWEITLQPGETKTLEIGYTVKYPKNAKIQMKTYRTVKAPKYM